MIYKNWEPFYIKILDDFNFSIENDEKSAKILDKILQKQDINLLKKLLCNKDVVVFGAGPSLEQSIIVHKKKIENMVKISADGATSALLKNNVVSDIIVTDLDGKISDQINSNKNDSISVIHAHGDNIENIKKYVPQFKGIIFGTTQTNPQPFDNLYNFGGFTDGDRAVFLADHFQAKKIYLIGFDFNAEIGRYSFTNDKNKNQKLKKLKWCKYLLEELNKNNSNIQYL